MVSLMGITSGQIQNLFPQLFHVASDGSWENILKYGLLSTTAILDLVKANDKTRKLVEASHRPRTVEIQHNEKDIFRIRDQKPLSEKKLARVLIDQSPAEWYRVLNARVFFWLTPKRLETLLSARAYRNDQHCVLTFDTEALLERYWGQVSLSPINSGSTVYRAQARGSNTFLAPSLYPFAEWAKKRGNKRTAIAELTIDYAIPDIEAFTLSVDNYRGPEKKGNVWKKS